MFIDLSFGAASIDPSRYLTTLVVSVAAPKSHPVCGVFAGNDFEFSEDERKKIVPFIGYDRLYETTWQDEDMSEFMPSLFVIDRPKVDATHHLSKWHYAVIGWYNAVYVEYPCVHLISLQEIKNDDGTSQWSLSVSDGLGRLNFMLCLPNYQLGAVARGVVDLQTR